VSRKICVFTGTRAEYGLLRSVVDKLKACGTDVFWLVSGSHLAASYGDTLREIEADALAPCVRADIGLTDNSPSGVCDSMGRAMSLYGRILAAQKPDIMLVLGDRYEAFCAVAAAVVQRVPVAHLYGGETTLGAIDEYFRNAMTTMSQLHFTSCEAYLRRVIQLGADPSKAWNVGALGVENVLNMPVLPEEHVRAYLGIPESAEWIVATWHPETLCEKDPVVQVATLANALDDLAPLHIVFTGANADAGGKAVNDWLQQWAVRSPRHHFFLSLGVQRYINAARYAKAVVGNSSSGVIEIPSLRVPVLDVGDRQKGRERSGSVMHCACKKEDFSASLRNLLDQKYQNNTQTFLNPYEKTNSSGLIVDYLFNS
jgi:UDP-hydrolysing UDP-N-acetyl-D-glucosamine 2-epimerase